MARRNIRNPIDDGTLNDFNHNFIELYQKADNFIDEMSDEAFNKVVDNAKLDWSKMVNKKTDLPTNAKKGTTIGVKEDSKVYRFNGTDWDDIYEINLNPISEVDERLSSQLAEKANKNEIQKDLNKKRDKNVKITKSDYDLSSDKNRWNVNDLDEPTRQAILENNEMDINYILGENAVVRENIASRAVGINETDFIRHSSRNLFKGEYNNFYIRSAAPHDLVESDALVSTTIEVEGGSVLFFYLPNTEMDRFAVAQFTELPKVGSVPTKYRQESEGGEIESDFYMIKMQEETKYIVITFSTRSSNKTPRFLVVTTSRIELHTNGRSFGNVIDINVEETIPDNSLTANKVDFTVRNHKNLFNGVFYEGHMRGATPHDVVFTSRTGRYALIKIREENTYYLHKSNDTNRLIVGFFDHEPNHGSIPIKHTSFASTNIFVESPENSKYMMVVVTATFENKIPKKLMVSETPINHYEPPYKFNESKVGLTGLETGINDDKSHFYVSGSLDARYNVIVGDVTRRPVLRELYDHYDNLMGAYPNYISREKLGEEATGLPIYIYHFTPPSTRDFTERLPKILFVGGIHGAEKMAVEGAMRFFQDLCENWEQNKLLEVLRWNVHFIAVPAFNAWGIENNERSNSNGVNLNRNFPHNWEYSDIPFDSSGPRPLSEIEAQLMDAFLDDNKDIMFAIDHHRFNNFEQDGYAVWTGNGRSEKIDKWLSGWSRNMNAKFYEMHSDLVNDNESVVSVKENYASIRPGWLSHHFYEKGIPGTILEVSASRELLDYTTSVLGSLFGSATKYMHKNKEEWL